MKQFHEIVFIDWNRERLGVPRLQQGWMDNGTRNLLEDALKGITKPVIVELGSWLGLSATFFLDKFMDSHVICIDHWLGSQEHQKHELVKSGKLFDTFLVNMWSYRHRLTILKSDTITGLWALRKLGGVHPSLFYVDSSHETRNVFLELVTIITLFPEAKIAGHDYNWASVKEAVNMVARSLGLRVKTAGYGWTFI